MNCKQTSGPSCTANKEALHSKEQGRKADKRVCLEEPQTGNKLQGYTVFLKWYRFPVSSLPPVDSETDQIMLCASGNRGVSSL